MNTFFFFTAERFLIMYVFNISSWNNLQRRQLTFCWCLKALVFDTFIGSKLAANRPPTVWLMQSWNVFELRYHALCRPAGLGRTVTLRSQADVRPVVADRSALNAAGDSSVQIAAASQCLRYADICLRTACCLFCFIFLYQLRRLFFLLAIDRKLHALDLLFPLSSITVFWCESQAQQPVTGL